MEGHYRWVRIIGTLINQVIGKMHLGKYYFLVLSFYVAYLYGLLAKKSIIL